MTVGVNVDVDTAPQRRQHPPKQVKLLLPVWGLRYILQFLEFSLPTLLAPGNLPAVAKELSSEFVFLTSSEDAEILTSHPGIEYLETICPVRLQIIDDLITGDNYSTTITLAYERAVRDTGQDVTDTCFFFLISDYLVANGSFRNVLARIQAGASGVLAGNFQVIEQEAATTFGETFDHSGGPELILPARKLVGWALRHLHPMTAANTANFPLSNTSHTNRLFWSVDENTLIGRFYLMHMICIRPETSDFVIGSSCDYSFVPEMCPSGSVEIITDSDEYLVVEMQPRDHERALLELGPRPVKMLARSLSEWTTAQHRANVRQQLIFHASEVSSAVDKVTAEAEAFIEQVNRFMTLRPQPHRGHPYWIGAIAAHKWAANQIHGADASAALLFRPSLARVENLLLRTRDLVFGRPPIVLPWHPRWPDYRSLASKLRSLLSGAENRSLCVVTATPFQFSRWIDDIAPGSVLFALRRFANLKKPDYMPLVGAFRGCLVLLSEDELETARPLLERVRPLVGSDGFILIAVMNGRGAICGDSFNRSVAHHSAGLLDLGTRVDELAFVTGGPWRWPIMSLMVQLYLAMLRMPMIYYPFAALSAIPLLAGSFLANLMCRCSGLQVPRNGHCSSLQIVLRNVAQPNLPEFRLRSYQLTDRYARVSKPAASKMTRVIKGVAAM